MFGRSLCSVHASEACPPLVDQRPPMRSSRCTCPSLYLSAILQMLNATDNVVLLQPIETWCRTEQLHPSRIKIVRSHHEKCRPSPVPRSPPAPPLAVAPTRRSLNFETSRQHFPNPHSVNFKTFRVTSGRHWLIRSTAYGRRCPRPEPPRQACRPPR